jgi:hypothetical protein
MQWVLVRPTTPEGVTLGIELGGTIPAGTRRQIVDEMASQTPAFAPLITNATGRSLTITVNAGLAGAMPCHCWIGAGTTRVHVGYYPLFQNSSARAEDQAGHSATFYGLGVKVDQDDGTIGLRFEEKDFR